MLACSGAVVLRPLSRGGGEPLTLKDSRKLLQSNDLVVSYPDMQELVLGRVFPELLDT